MMKPLNIPILEDKRTRILDPASIWRPPTPVDEAGMVSEGNSGKEKSVWHLEELMD